MRQPQSNGFGGKSNRVVLLIIFVPSADRQGASLGAGVQDDWRERCMRMFGEVFGGATAYPKAEGVWLDPANNNLIRDQPYMVHCYVKEDDAHDAGRQARVGNFCRLMKRELRQGEVALIFQNQMISF